MLVGVVPSGARRGRLTPGTTNVGVCEPPEVDTVTSGPGGWQGDGRRVAVGCEVWWAGIQEGGPDSHTIAILLGFLLLGRTSQNPLGPGSL